MSFHRHTWCFAAVGLALALTAVSCSGNSQCPGGANCGTGGGSGGGSGGSGGGPACSTASCEGCCDANGVCQSGTSASACGYGKTCAVCAGQQTCAGSGSRGPWVRV